MDEWRIAGRGGNENVKGLKRNRCVRLLPADIYNTAALEEYLSKMAGKGYFLTGTGSLIGRFEKKEPEAADYLMMPLGKKEKEPDPDERRRLEDKGWSYVCTVAGSFHIYVSCGKHEEDVRQSAAADSYTAKCLRRRLDTGRYVFPLLLAAVLMMVGTLAFSPRPMRLMIQDNVFPFMLWYMVYVIYAVWTFWYDRRRLKRLAGDKGRTKNTKKIKLREGYLLFGCHALLLLSGAAVLCAMFYGMGAKFQANLWEYQGYRPAVTLSQIEQDPSMQMSENEYDSRISYEWSLLAPKMFKIDETGVRSGSGQAEESQDSVTEVVGLHTEVYELRFIAMAEPLMKELIGYYGFRFNLPGPISYEELYDSDFDRAIYMKAQEKQMIFAVSGRKLVYVNYNGSQDLKWVFLELGFW